MAKSLIGIVASNKTDKTIVVAVHLHKIHPIYKKAYSVTKRFMAHDEKNEAQVGDTVSIVETRPISARKHYKLVKIVEKAAISADKTVDAVTVKADEVVKKKKTDEEEQA